MWISPYSLVFRSSVNFSIHSFLCCCCWRSILHSFGWTATSGPREYKSSPSFVSFPLILVPFSLNYIVQMELRCWMRRRGSSCDGDGMCCEWLKIDDTTTSVLATHSYLNEERVIFRVVRWQFFFFLFQINLLHVFARHEKSYTSRSQSFFGWWSGLVPPPNNVGYECASRGRRCLHKAKAKNE